MQDKPKCIPLALTRSIPYGQIKVLRCLPFFFKNKNTIIFLRCLVFLSNESVSFVILLIFFFYSFPIDILSIDPSISRSSLSIICAHSIPHHNQFLMYEIFTFIFLIKKHSQCHTFYGFLHYCTFYILFLLVNTPLSD
eukprot:gene12200-8396_t